VRLKSLAKRESKGDLNLTPILRSGNSFHGIITTARERAVDLIVIATHGYTGAKRVLLGSTTERVVRHAPCPVLTVPVRTTPTRRGKMPPIDLKRILVPVDFSKASKAALPWAASLAAESNAELILVHVVEKFLIDYVLGHEFMNETITPLMKKSEAELRQMAESLSKSTGLKAAALIRNGKPFKEICSAAEKLGAGLIAQTTRGYTGLKHVWLGSTAERVVRHASCPVLTVRELNRRKP
jgi:nucleotide-binding universal stress UspA family protein